MTSEENENIESKLPWIRGWLLLPAVGIAISPFLNLNNCIELFNVMVDADWSIMQQKGQIAVVGIVYEVFVQLYMLIFSTVLAVAFFARRKVLPKLFVIYFISVFLLGLIGAGLYVSIPGMPKEVIADSFAFPMYVFMVGLIWCPYFLLSKRVKNTFIVK